MGGNSCCADQRKELLAQHREQINGPRAERLERQKSSEEPGVLGELYDGPLTSTERRRALGLANSSMLFAVAG